MGVTIREIMTLPSMRGARIAAGLSGIDQEVKYVTVQDFFNIDPHSEALFQSIPFPQGELMITSMTDISRDVSAQCRALRAHRSFGDVGVLLYYVGLVVPAVDPQLLAVADELSFPLILMPEEDESLRYSDAIREIMELVIRDENRARYFLPELLQIIISQQEQESMEWFLTAAGQYLEASLLLTDSSWNLLDGAMLPSLPRSRAAELVRQVAGNINSGRADTPEGPLHFVVGTVQQRDGADLNLVVLRQGEALSSDALRQVVEAVQTFLGLHRQHYMDNDPAGLVGAVLKGSRSAALRIAQQLRLDLESFNTLAVVGPVFRRVLRNPQHLLSRVREELRYRYPGCIAELYHGAVVILGGTELGRNALNDALPVYIGMPEAEIDTMLYVCPFLRGVEEFRDAYQLILTQKDNAAYLYPNWHALSSSHLRLAETCQRLTDQGQAQAQRRILAPLHEIDEPLRTELHRTLAVYLLDAYLSISRTAELMYLHKNTIKYRIKKINACLGFNVAEMPEMSECYLACAIERYLSGIELSVWTNNAYHNCF